MKKYFIGLALSFFAMGATAADGNELLQRCSSAIDFIDGNQKDADVTKLTHTNYCWGIVEGVTGAVAITVMMSEDSNSRPYFNTCISKLGLKNSQTARITVQYLKANPENLHLPAPALVILALREAFPCK